MKKLRERLDNWFNKLDERWRSLPVKRQRKYTLLFFMGYLLLTVIVIAKVWFDTSKPNPTIEIRHIENPVIQKKKSETGGLDSLSNILKEKFYERKWK